MYFIIKKTRLESKGLKFHVDTFFGHRNLATFDDLDILSWTVAGFLLHFLDRGYDIHALKDFSKNDMTPIKPTTNYISLYHPQLKTIQMSNCSV